MEVDQRGSGVDSAPVESAIERSMLTPEELSARIAIPAGTLSNWRVRRKAGDDIGPSFVKIGSIVRYRITDVEAWEAGLHPHELDGPSRVEQDITTARRRGVNALRTTLLTPRELSKRTGLRVDYLSNWRVRRNFGEEIGPDFVKIGGLVRYRVKDVERWEATHAQRDKKFPASTKPTFGPDDVILRGHVRETPGADQVCGDC